MEIAFFTYCMAANGLDHLPEEVHQKEVYGIAWELGHSASFSEVDSYVDDFAHLVSKTYRLGREDGMKTALENQNAPGGPKL